MDEVTSTSDIVAQRARAGGPEGLCVIAARQTAGRGRRGRGFFSPASGLYMSVLLRPCVPADDAQMTTVAAAVAAAEAIEALSGRETRIKWVNDILIEGRKVCGILTESDIVDGRIAHSVLGIGVDIEEPEGGFPAEIAAVAGAVFPRGGGDRLRLAEEILNRFFAYYERLREREYMPAYRSRSSVLGRTVTILGEGGGPVEAVAIDDDAALIVRTGSGELRRLFAGEVSVRTEQAEDD